MLPAMQILVSIGTMGAFPQIGEILPPCAFFDCWENMPPKLNKMSVNGQFQAKTTKYKNHNISKTINGIKTKFEDQAEIGNCTTWVV